MKILDAEFVASQIDVVLGDIGADAVKTGLLFNAEIVEFVSSSLTESHAAARALVVDPVLVAGDGRRLVSDETIAAYTQRLFPRALLITPNLDEAAILTGLTVNDTDMMRETARMLQGMGPRYVLVKGGHLGGTEIILDMLYDGAHFYEYRGPRLPVPNARGAGCTFASCVTAEVAKGRDVPTAVGIAREYVTAALRAASEWRLGQGRGTLFHSTGRPPLFD